MTKNATVNAGHGVYTHPAHVDGLHAPDAAGLAEHGIPTASATQLVEGDELRVSRETADRLAAAGVART